MPFTGDTFSVYTPGNPVVAGTIIDPAVHNQTNTDIATGLSAVAARITRLLSITSVAALKALTGMVSNQGATLLGYYTPGDGGGGPQRYFATGAAPGTYVDNGGSIILPTGGNGSQAWLWSYAGAVNLKWFGAKGDNSTNDTAAVRAWYAAYSADTPLFVPAGRYVVSNSAGTPNVITITGSRSIFGENRQDCVFVFAPTANGAVFKVANGAAKVSQFFINDIGFYSTDTTYTKVALDVYDLSSCGIQRIRVAGNAGAGPSSGACWSGGAGSVGLRTHGRETTGVSDLEIIADYPIYIAANPNTSATDGEDMDHWTWRNCYLVGNGYYCITVADGLGIMETGFEGYQAWVGGTGGFYMNDTRVSPVVASRGIRFRGVRTEQQTDVNGYAFNMSFTATGPVQSVSWQNIFMSNACQGIKMNRFIALSLDEVLAAVTAGKDSFVCTNGTGPSSISLRGCAWNLGSNFSTSLFQIAVMAFEAGTNAGPEDAFYAGTRNGTTLNVAGLTSTVVDGTTGVLVTGLTGDALQINPQAATGGVSLRAMNNSVADFTPLTFTFSIVDLRYRTGVGTSATMASIDTSGQLKLTKRLYPATDALAQQTSAGLFAGNGAPNNANGSNGDFYLRGDGTQAGNTCIYHKEGGAWIALVTT